MKATSVLCIILLFFVTNSSSQPTYDVSNTNTLQVCDHDRACYDDDDGDGETLKMLQQQFVAMETQFLQVKSHLNDIRNKTAITTTLYNCTGQQQGNEHQLGTVQSEMAALKNELAQLKAQFDSFLTGMTAPAAGGNCDCSQQETQLELLQNLVLAINGEMLRLNERVDNILPGLPETTTTRAAAPATNNNNCEEIESLRVQFIQFKERIENILVSRTTMGPVSDPVTRQELQALQNQLNALRSNISALQGQMQYIANTAPTSGSQGSGVPPSGVHPSITCPANFTLVRSVGSCFYVVTDKLQWSQANHRCISLHPDAHLAAITSPAKQTIVSGLLFRHSYPTVNNGWTAGQRVNPSQSSSPFIWRISSSNDYRELPLNFTSWMPGNPDNGTSDLCITLLRERNYMWYDSNCHNSNNAVCEINVA